MLGLLELLGLLGFRVLGFLGFLGFRDAWIAQKKSDTSTMPEQEI